MAFVLTHLIMGFCIVTIALLAISPNNSQDDTFEKSKAIQKPVLINDSGNVS